MRNEFGSWCLVALQGLVALSIAPMIGCVRAPAPSFVVDESLKALPETHQKQIANELTRIFGTPLNPRLEPPTARQLAADGDVGDAGAAAQGQKTAEQQLATARLQHGAGVFMRRCAGCHGVSGDGGGEAAAYLRPKPRDYRRGIFKFTSTPYGAKPNRKDLIRVVRRGAKGTSMPAFPFLADEELRDVVDYVILLSYRGELERALARVAEFDDYAPDEEIEASSIAKEFAKIDDAWQLAEFQEVLPVTAQPKYSDESILAGREAFLGRACSKCHGENAEGQSDWLSHKFLAAQAALPEGERQKLNYDAWGQIAPAADLTAGMLHGGRRPIDIYRRIYTGINGTPMPAFNQDFAAEPEKIWNLVHYVQSVVEHRHVEGLDRVTAPVAAQPASAGGGG